VGYAVIGVHCHHKGVEPIIDEMYIFLLFTTSLDNRNTPHLADNIYPRYIYKYIYSRTFVYTYTHTHTRWRDIRRMLPTPPAASPGPQEVMVDLYGEHYYSPPIPGSAGRKSRARHIMSAVALVLVVVSALLAAGSFGLKILVRR